MGREIINMVGKRFGRLTVFERAANQEQWNRDIIMWACHCDCGRNWIVRGSSLRNGSTRSCGCLMTERRKMGPLLGKYGKLHPRWKGGRSKNSKGYIQIYEGGKRKYEHVLVMETALGRLLLPKETVHHINGIVNDNRLENLELWSSNHPSGQRVKDKVAWAIENLKIYKPEVLVEKDLPRR